MIRGLRAISWFIPCTPTAPLALGLLFCDITRCLISAVSQVCSVEANDAHKLADSLNSYATWIRHAEKQGLDFEHFHPGVAHHEVCALMAESQTHAFLLSSYREAGDFFRGRIARPPARRYCDWSIVGSTQRGDGANSHSETILGSSALDSDSNHRCAYHAPCAQAFCRCGHCRG